MLVYNFRSMFCPCVHSSNHPACLSIFHSSDSLFIHLSVSQSPNCASHQTASPPSIDSFILPSSMHAFFHPLSHLVSPYLLHPIDSQLSQSRHHCKVDTSLKWMWLSRWPQLHFTCFSATEPSFRLTPL